MDTICERVVGSIPEAQKLLSQSILSYCDEARRNLDMLSTRYHRSVAADGFETLARSARNPFFLSGTRYDSFAAWLSAQYVAHDIRLQNPIMPFIAVHVGGGRKAEYTTLVGHRHLPSAWPPSAKEFAGYIADACIVAESHSLWQKISQEIDEYAHGSAAWGLTHAVPVSVD